ncbi:hypothetical protein Zmor_019524 [Zophobas morio]|uniref:limulus clotting factor C n=1 Tax=Zophobas morio TaxID=2755281 RepID=A0AA38I267_9CUCU|nr:hypothetical protein Zmor_019524 [Zophobas morio]
MCGQQDQTYKVCCPEDNHDLSSHRNFHLLPLTTCGFILHGGRITNGDTASPREFPWMALIAYKTEDENEFKCGGSLITRNYVLTAAHCVDDKSVLGVRLGEYDISLEHECDDHQNCEPPVQDIIIDKVIIHKNYNPSTYINDIALVRLLVPANIENANIKPICLPTGDLLKTNLFGKYLTVTGWGTTESGHKSMILKKVSVPVVRLSACRRAYGKQILHPKKQICAGGHEGKDSCSGDSGGPLQYIAATGGSQRYVQDGIVSYGPKQCGLEDWPGIYTNVKEYMSWILDNIGP